MPWSRSSTVDELPHDPVGEVAAAAIAAMLGEASVELVYSPEDGPLPEPPDGLATASATGPGPRGWRVTMVARLDDRLAPLTTAAGAPLLEVLRAAPAAGLRAAAQFPTDRRAGAVTLSPSLQRALRDTIVVETLGAHHGCALGQPVSTTLLAATIEFLIELSGTRVESHDITHGVIISNVLPDRPRLEFRYPDDVRAAKRAPLLFDGQRSVLVVDPEGRARTELQRHRLQRLNPSASPLRGFVAELAHSGSFVAEGTRHLGGIGFFLRADRTIWVFADGQPILIRRGERWTAFPLELATAIANTISASAATAEILVRAAFIISSQRHGAILAIVEDPDSLAPIVSAKDRYDLRNALDPDGMQAETRLHHLIDAEDLDAQTLARLAALDGATILDRDGHLLAYGAIVTSSDSQHEGARTAAAKTLSHTAEIVLKISADGDITVFRDGEALAKLLS
ncbi:MAG: diadenylate cyclase [Acidimicrobiia bacterium]